MKRIFHMFPAARPASTILFFKQTPWLVSGDFSGNSRPFFSRRVSFFAVGEALCFIPLLLMKLCGSSKPKKDEDSLEVRSSFPFSHLRRSRSRLTSLMKRLRRRESILGCFSSSPPSVIWVLPLWWLDGNLWIVWLLMCSSAFNLLVCWSVPHPTFHVPNAQVGFGTEE